MKKVSMTDARKDLPEIVNKACYGGERTIIQRHGADCVAIVPVTDLEIIEYVSDLIDIRDAEKSLAEAKVKGIRSFDELLKELGISKE